ncbi:MAG: VWA domain-containing protein [Phycisphaerales bacterium]
MTFHSPSIWLLLLLPLALLAWARWASPRRRATMAFSDLAPVRASGRGLAARLWWIVPTLRALAVALLVVCLARPIKADEQVRVDVEGVAIVLVVDRSGSMQALDFVLDGKRVDRLAAVKDVVRDFMHGDGKELAGRPDDLVGLVVFARNADALCPLTLDHDHLLAALDGVRPATVRGEDGTAIGDGLALAVERLRDATSRAGADAARRIRSKVIVLLTDGENNSGEIEPMVAAQLAASAGIKVYAIGTGTRGMAPFPVEMMGQRVLQQMPVSIDEPTLTKIAESTGGRYFRATDTQSLRNIYTEIDSLEKSRNDDRRTVLFTDLAVEPLAAAVGRFLPSCCPSLPLLGELVAVSDSNAGVAVRVGAGEGRGRWAGVMMGLSGWWLVVTGYWLLVTGCWSLVSGGGWLLDGSSPPSDRVRCLLPSSILACSICCGSSRRSRRSPPCACTASGARCGASPRRRSCASWPRARRSRADGCACSAWWARWR